MTQGMTRLERLLLKITTKPKRAKAPGPLLVELLGRPSDEGRGGEVYPFTYEVTTKDGVPFYELGCSLSQELVTTMRKVVGTISGDLDPGEVEPLTFGRLIEVLSQHSAQLLPLSGVGQRVKVLSELAAYEAIGLSRILAIAKDEKVTEFFVDSEVTPVYLDHAVAGRCESSIVLTERERDALQTHLDTFSGYTLDYKVPSLKNDLTVSGALLRISLDLEPLSVSRFALDVRRLNVTSMSLQNLILLGVISGEAAALVVAWLESGGNVTIIGETGTGKTTLLNAFDEQVDRRMRRLYIEDAVETRDMLEGGYHQMKVKVDPFERGEDAGKTKESEIVKALHRSPDIVILSEIQSEEHSRAFFQALASGVRGLQTFHASSIEQALRRWTGMHRISEQSLAELGLMVQMTRPDRLRQERFVQRVCVVAEDARGLRVKELYMRNREFKMICVAGPEFPTSPIGVEPMAFERRFRGTLERIARTEASR
jgi:type IV secretory pathway ATPase VirB11/archaellum biosynthesis ATPase